MKTGDATKGIYILQAFWEFAGSIGESTIKFPLTCQVLGGGRPVRKSDLGSAHLILIRARAEVPPLRPAEIHETLILHNSRDPRVELRVAAETPQVLKGGEIGRLNSIKGLFVRTQNSTCD